MFFAACEELHIVEDQQVYLQVKVLELLELMVLQRVEELRCKVILIDVQHYLARHVVLDLIADGLHEVGFANTYTSVQHQRVEVMLHRVSGYCQTG